jgi:undecaprenyl-diphosphatase
MVIMSSVFHIADDEFTKYFEVCIQFGAILSVVLLYFRKFIDLKNIQFYMKLLVAIIPSLILGYFLNDFIDEKLGSPAFIATIMILGGILLLFVDRWFSAPIYHNENDVDMKHAFKIGLFQCLAIIFPGLSRSAATIIGGMSQRITKEVAAEFSFFLAVPTMFAATAFRTLKYVKAHGMFTQDQWLTLTVGNAVAFIVALLAIRFFIQYVKQKGFRLFGVYRILLGCLVFVLLAMKWI